MSYHSTSSKTITISPWTNAISTLHLTSKEKISLLAENMRMSQLFSSEVFGQIQEADSTFNQIMLNTEEDKEDASLVLCFLLCDVIRATLLKEENSSNQETLFKFEDELKAILTSTLPKGENIDNFIKEYEQFSQKQILFNEKLIMIETSFMEQIKQIYVSANEINQELMQKFTVLKERLLELNDQRQSMTKEICSLLDVITEKVDTVSKELTLHAAKAQTVGERMQNEQKVAQQLLNTCYAILKKV